MQGEHENSTSKSNLLSDRVQLFCWSLHLSRRFSRGPSNWSYLTPALKLFPHGSLADVDAHGTAEDASVGLLQFTEPPAPLTPPPPDPKPPSPQRSPPPPPPRLKPHFVPRAPTGYRGGGRGARRGLGRGQMFDDPAVIRIVEGRPSLKVRRTNPSNSPRNSSRAF